MRNYDPERCELCSFVGEGLLSLGNHLSMAHQDEPWPVPPKPRRTDTAEARRYYRYKAHNRRLGVAA